MLDKHYTTEDLEDSLRQAFVVKRADYIIFDGQVAGNQFLTDSINLGVKNGWLEDQVIEEEQWTATKYRLSTAGKKYFGLE